MRRSEFSEERLEELLKSLPKVEDHRNPQEIYQNISLQLNRRKKRKTWLVPSLATAAAALLFIILLPNIFEWNESAFESSQTDNAGANEKMGIMNMEEAEMLDATDMERANISEVEGKLSITPLNTWSNHTSLYLEDIFDNQEAITFLVPDNNVQNMVPISVVVEKMEGKEKLDRVLDVLSSIDEESLGLSEFYPLNATITMREETNELIVDVPKDHLYGNTAISGFFLQALKNIAKSVKVERIVLQTEGTPGIDLGNYGILDSDSVEENTRHGYYFYYVDNQQYPYLVPSPMTFNDINSALRAMEENVETHQLTRSIPDEVHFETIQSDGETLVLELTEDSYINDSDAFVQTIEAVLLTAKEFNFSQVKVESAMSSQFGKFSLNDVWDVPIGPNKKVLYR